ncbi:hypothetical protein E2C01_053942 [Portunus trituberculatus]|uniref:Uncharacterized protein n=1 Tax=Portunus trituberculatus TaxID=210409 RepID=A0A5B7GQM4_PORTR|nr:hypothetical protein [Portunus trituberculatus]
MSGQWSVFGEDLDGFQLVGKDSLSSSTDSLSSASHHAPSTASYAATTTTHSTRISSTHSTHSNLASSRASPQDTPEPPLARPSRERESYLTSLRRAFSRRPSGERGNVPPSPPPPPSSRRASTSSESSLEAPNLDTLGGLFTAALSFGDACDRRAAAARTVTDLPLSPAYNHRATWGDVFGGRRARRRTGRRRSSAGSSDEERGSTPFLRDAFGFPAVLGALFGSRRKK